MALLQHRHFHQLVTLYVCLLASLAIASREFLPDEIAQALQSLRKHKDKQTSTPSKLSQIEQSPAADPPGIMTKRLAMPNVLPNEVSTISGIKKLDREGEGRHG